MCLAANVSFTKATGPWVDDGTVFYLVDSSDDSVLDTVTVTHTCSTCLPKNAACTLDSQCCSNDCKPNGKCK